MDTPELETFFEVNWLSTIKLCVDKMEREDRRTIRSFRTLEDVQQHVIDDPDDLHDASEFALQELALIGPRLVDLRDFSTFFAQKLGPALDPAVFWGFLGLMLTLALQYDDEAMKRLAQMLKKLGWQVELFQGHCLSRSNTTKQEKESCFESFINLTKFFASTVVFFRNSGDDLHHASASDDDPWRPLMDSFATTTHDLEDSLRRIEKLAAIKQPHTQELSWLYSILALSPRSFRDDVAELPCFMMPPAQNPKFFDRDEIIMKIDEHFRKKEPTSFRSLALYGMGGVGKSHVAMKYAERTSTRRVLNAVFWVQAETTLSMKQSFTDIALRLKLPNTNPRSHDDNRLVVMNWLQRTQNKWLIVYDNVEAFEILRSYWPSSTSRGRALITTRNHSLAFEPADCGLEVPPWDTETGSKFLLHLLAGHISSDLLANQAQSALDLSERLSGHALALANMGGIIHRRSWSIQELVEVYDRQPNFKDGLEPIWQVSFQSLQPRSTALLSILAFVNPDSIPQSIFEPESPEVLPPDLKWCQDEELLSEAIEELQLLALIKRDRHTRNLSVHRLIQTHFRMFIGDEGRQAAFIRTSALLYNAFPQRDAAKAQLFDVWERCSLWVQHVIALKDAFSQERKRTPTFKACRDFCELLVNCQRFVLEQHQFPDLQDMVDVNNVALSTLDDVDRTFDMLASLPSHLGQMQVRLGQSEKALQSSLLSKDIRMRDPQGDEREIVWAEHNVAQVLLSTGRLDEGLEWHTKARDRWNSWAELQSPPAAPWPAILRVSYGRALLIMGRLAEARPILESAITDILDVRPVNWALAAHCQFALGRLEMGKKNFEIAEERFMEAQSFWLQGDKARTDHFNGACMYRMACCALDQGKIEAALKHLQDALIVTLVHKEYMPGEHARCLFKLSQALSLDEGREIEADETLKVAEELYFTRAEDVTINPREEDYDRLVYCIWR